MGAAAQAGRDKLTLVAPPALEAFGLWVEQLIAESTGKNGTGVVPIAGEPLGRSGRLRQRSPVRPDARGTAPPARTRATPASAPSRRRGAPVVDIDLPEPLALGAEFVRWEIATAVAGALLGINPFDEPNVQQAKDATNVLLTDFKTKGRLPIAGARPARSTASR